VTLSRNGGLTRETSRRTVAAFFNPCTEAAMSTIDLALTLAFAA
jgi:hypothetical protein